MNVQDANNEKPKKLHLFNLSAKYVGKTIEADVFVAGESAKKALPGRVYISCKKCGSGLFVSTNEQALLARHFIFSNKQPEMPWLFYEKRQIEEKCTDGGEHDLKVNVLRSEMTDFRIIYARDLPSEIEKFEEQTFQTTKAYVVGKKIPYTRRVRIKGTVTTDPKKKDIILIVQDIQPLEEDWQNFQPSEKDKKNFDRHFRDISPYTLAFQIAPKIVGEKRVQLKVAYHLVLHSPRKIRDVKGDRIRGTIKIIVIGDTSTGKTKTGQDCTEYYCLGDFISGDSASRTGLTYCIDPDKKVILWGALPLNDGGLVIVDGLQDLPEGEWDKLTEPLRTERVIVRRSVSGEAPARTRVIANMNPRRGHPMSSYAYACQAIFDNEIFNREKNITRFDLFIPVFSDDVSADDIMEKATSREELRPIPKEVYLHHVYWIWSRKPEQIEWMDDARKRLILLAKAFMKHCNLIELPIVHNGYRDVLCRIVVAWAGLVHSTDENHEKIIVRVKHVNEALKYVVGVLKRWQLLEYKKVMMKKSDFAPSEFELLIGTLDEIDIGILGILSLGTCTASRIGEIVSMSREAIWQHFRKLKAVGLLDAKTGVGAKLTVKGSKLWKRIRSYEDISDGKGK